MSLVATDEFEAFCGGVRRLCGLDLTQYKRGQMERRVRAFIERRGVAGMGPYLERLRRDPAELDAFLDRVTINVSELWRHPGQWDVLARDVLPDLARAGRVRAWSAGCSYGAEAYTLAAVCADLGIDATITGTDIDQRMVARARAGVFGDADARHAPQRLIAAHFRRTDDGWLASDRLRAMVRFQQGDLLRLSPPPGSYDLVLCRNTVIYFTEEVRDALHARLVKALRPGGYLVVGGTERVMDPASLGLTGSQIYRKG